ncbi:tripartite motif-containing protein 2-like [Actinia tenebrosa]|uniref:Tripartite motif-containing protein 2-like n=1 Tax=Actinia tenebrosa TaxID=6105 RepID=A0A6P8GXH1_ACTTE|nr:tripartite motif-containing protein 2-like [Actinia tenebrosa]
MASSGVLDVSPQILDELSCCVCRELLREPKILGCGHTACIDCLANMVELELINTGDVFALHQPRLREVIRCPICRNCTNIPVNGIDEFPTNYLVKSMVELNLGLGDVREIKTKISESKNVLGEVQIASTTIDEIMKMVEDKKQTVISDINQVFDSLVERLRDRQEQLTERCCSKAAVRLRDLRHQKQCTKAVERIMKETIERVELSMACSVADVLQRKEAVLEELSQLDMFLVFNEPREVSEFKFVVEGEQEIMNRISEFGDIHCSFDGSDHIVPVAVPSHIMGVDVLKVIDSFNNDGENDEQSTLTLPWGVTTTNTDIIIVTDHHQNRVLQFDVEGNFLKYYAEEHDIHLPTGVAVSDEGNFMVLDSGNHCIKELNSSGDLVRSIGKMGSGSGEIGERAEGITVDHEGRLIVADTANNRVQVFHRNGRMALKFGDTGNECLSRPSCAVYHKGKFIVSDTHNHCLKFYNRNGLLIRQVGIPGKESGQFSHPRGLTVDGNDNILVCDSGNCRIQVLDFNGNFITSFGTMGGEDGQFCFPYAIAINSQGSMVVTDCNNNRIQILRFKIPPN